MRYSKPAFALALAVAAAGAIAQLTARVSVVNGAPRLLVNGKPVRARMFFGGPGSNPIDVGSQGRRVEFDFEAGADSEGQGTMHFRFGQNPGVIDVDDIRVTDAETGNVVVGSNFDQGPGSFGAQWIRFPEDARNAVGTEGVEPGAGVGGSGGLRVSLKAPPSGAWPDYHIYHAANLALAKGRTYHVSFWCRAEPARQISVAFYKPGEVFLHLGGPPGRFESQIKLAAAAGVDFVTFIVPTPWPEPGKPVDWAPVDAEVDRVLAANPRALCIPRFGMEPPAWWAKAHPDDMMEWESGLRQYCAVPASPTYQRDAAEAARALVEHLEARYPNRMAGYHPCGQNTGEWFYLDTWENRLNGYAPADRDAWRVWLRRLYGTNAALQAAWRAPAATLDAATVPDAASRRAAPNGVLRVPGAEQRLIDFTEYQQAAMADLVTRIAGACRKASGGRKLVVVFYGYAFEFGAVALGSGTSGHYAMRRILSCPDIDIVCSPISYGDRGLGQTGPTMSCAESVAIAGKMWLQEDDTRTHMSPDGPDAIARTSTPEASYNVLARNVVNEAARNFGTWWMDLGMAGWYDDPGMWRLNKRLAAVDRPFVQAPIPFRPQVAAVLDERSQMLAAPWAMDALNPAVYMARHALGRMGAPFGQYLLDDVAAGKVTARLYVLLNTWRLTTKQRADLGKATAGAVRLWCYAPGAFDDAGPSPEAMRALTGFRLEPCSPEQAMATPTLAGKRLGLTQPFGVAKAVKPLFHAADARPGEALATYADGSVAVALRRDKGGASLFCGVPGLSTELLRLAARAAGAHLYTETDCLVTANGPVVGLHATQDGPIRVRLPRAASMRDALTGAPLGKGTDLRLNLKKGDTRLILLGEPGRR